jgi:ubiquinone/menaquinone biosynthesis C-methylase UbiE
MSTDQQTINSYNLGAKDYSAKQPTSFYHKYVEKPAMYSLLSDLIGKKILCIGVGTGDEAAYLKKQGADVTGIDVSEGMINEAKSKFPELNFLVGDMNNLDFEPETFDLVYSSLVFHYAEDLEKLFRGINNILKREGKLLFSTSHPIFDSIERFETNDRSFTVIGHSKSRSNGLIEPIGDYFTEEKRTQQWSEDFIVNFFHHTLSSWINALVKSAFKVEQVVEPMPIAEAQRLFPEKYQIYTHRPGFIIFLCSKTS